MSSIPRSLSQSGVGLRLPHIEEAVAARPNAGWFEVHPENFLANPHGNELLQELARSYPISIHTVGLSVGSASGLDRRHLARVRALVDRIDPVLVSGHLAWSTHQGEYLNDLLPLPYTAETLAVVIRHLQEVQDGLGRPFLLENPSCYLGFIGSTMTEVQFLNELVDRSGCQLLCDVSNVCLSAHNMGYDAVAYLEGLPAHAVRELHLGGFTAEEDESRPGHDVLIDTHSTRVAEAAWDLYTHAVARFGATPTLIEWDNEIPSLGTLLEEAARADQIAQRTLSRGSAHALAR